MGLRAGGHYRDVEPSGSSLGSVLRRSEFATLGYNAGAGNPRCNAVMNVNELCVSICQSLPPLFVCSPAPQEGVRVRTPLLYPDGGVVDVFVLERSGSYTITDFGDALGWLGMQSVSRKRSNKQQLLIQDVCQTLRIELLQPQLVLRNVVKDALGESVLRVAQAVVRVSDLWFTLRSQTLQTTADEVDEWLHEKRIPFERQVTKQGRSTQNWTVDFETQIDNRTSLVFLLSTGSRGAVRRIAEHVLAGCVDLQHLESNQPSLAFISLFDDTEDVWRAEDFGLVEDYSKIARWSRPDELEQLLKAP